MPDPIVTPTADLESRESSLGPGVGGQPNYPSSTPADPNYDPKVPPTTPPGLPERGGLGQGSYPPPTSDTTTGQTAGGGLAGAAGSAIVGDVGRGFVVPETPGEGFGQGVWPTTPPTSPTVPPVNTGIGIDWFSNTDSIGFMTRTTRLNTDIKLNEFGGPVREQTKYNTALGTDKFTLTNKALTTLQGSPISSIPIQDPLFIDKQIFWKFNRYTDTSNFSTQFQGSRLLDLGDEGNLLDSYYAQLTHDESVFGLRNNSIHTNNLGFTGILKPLLKGINAIAKRPLVPYFEVPQDAQQPYVIRSIGQRWGVDKDGNKPDVSSIGSFGALVQVDNRGREGRDVRDTFINLIDSVNSGIIGREPSVFLDRYYSDVKRLNASTNALNFLARGSTFVRAQDKLQKRNRFDSVTSTKYQISNDHQYFITQDTFLPNGLRTGNRDGILLELNPKAYNPLSVFSIPSVLGINRSGYLDFNELIAHGTLADYISHKVLQNIQEKATKVVTSTMDNLADALGFGKKARQKIATDAIEQVKELPVYKTTDEYVNSLTDKSKKARKAAEAFGLIPENAPVGKASLNNMNIDLSDIGVDKVNLIPYGKDRDPITDRGLNELDWIPFKFKDSRLNAEGNKTPIVFRAILSGITDTFSPEYTDERYVGRPDKVYVYQGTSREISFTFDVLPKSDQELPVLWEKLNYLAGLTYPHWTNGGDGRAMIAPYCELTIGQMFKNTPGIITGLTYTVQDNGTWETTFAKLPKYIQVACTFTFIGKRLPAATQKHYELPWVNEEEYKPGLLNDFLGILKNRGGILGSSLTDIGNGGGQFTTAQELEVARINREGLADNPWINEDDEDSEELWD